MAISNHKQLNVFTSFLPMFYMSRLLGLFPLSYFSKRNAKKGRCKGRLPSFQHSSIVRAYSLLLLFFFVAAFVITFPKAIDAFSVFGNQEVNIAQSEFVSGMMLAPIALSCLLDLHFSATSGRRLSKIFSTISRLDRRLTHPLVPRGVIPRHARLRRIAIAQVVVVPTMVLFQSLADYGGVVTGRESHNNLIAFYVLRFISFTLEQQFIMVLLILRDRFGLVNHALRDVLLCSDISGGQNSLALAGMPNLEGKDHRRKRWRRGSPLNLPVLRLRRIRSAHFALSEEADLINDTYQLPLLAIVLGLFFDVIAGGYFLLDDILSSSTEFFPFLSAVMWISSGSLRIALLCWVARDTSVTRGKELDSMNALILLLKWAQILKMGLKPIAMDAQKWILKLREKKTDNTVIVELKTFVDYFLLSKVQFNICGLFVLDMTVVQAIAQASTSYLLVLMQFRQEG